MSWSAKKKAVASEGTNGAAAELRKHSDLMREMGSVNGAWNPEPDDHIMGILRDDVELSQNETKLIAYVKFCCTRLKSSGRSAWGKTESGKPLTIARIADHFGWDVDNARKHAKRPLAYGFVRVRQKPTGDEFGLGALVNGKFEPDVIERRNSEDENATVCTYRIPPYLLVDLQRLTQEDRQSFLQGWTERKQAAQDRINAAVAKCRSQEQEELSLHCKAFGLELKTGKKRREDRPETTGDRAAAEDSRPYVHTEFVHTAKPALYNGAGDSAHTSHIRKQSFTEAQSSSSSPSDRSTTSNENTFFQRVLKELAPLGADNPAVSQLIYKCRKNAPACEAEEIVHFIRLKTPMARKHSVTNPVGFLLTAVPKHFTGEAYAQFQREQRKPVQSDHPPQTEADILAEIADLEKWEKEIGLPAQAERARTRINELRAELDALHTPQIVGKAAV